jgi:galactokinase
MESSSFKLDFPKDILGRAVVKAPGKVIISGEHSVVYHYPALVMAVNLYTTALCTVYEG